ncbi:MAG TPA: MBL fold metallo-hydrolase [Jiangellaceae bacterium]|nr:MBL fold metallo-hydrolase [Jiangellaceae bacterium]
MRVTVIGCSGSLPGPESAASCYLLEAAGVRLVLDLGNGALGALQRHIALGDLDAVLLSHLHPDHCLDLCGLYVARRYGPEQPTTRIPVWGPPGTAARMANGYGLPVDPGMTEEFDFRHYPDAGFEVGPVRIRAARVVHPGQAFALRVEHAGRVLVYSGDTAPSSALVELAGGADVLVCEAGFPDDVDNAPGLHLTGTEAGEHAQAAGAGRLIVTHVPPWGDPVSARTHAAGAFDGPVELARPGLVVDV